MNTVNDALKHPVGVIYERCPFYCKTRRWQALAYHDYITRHSVMVIWPLHYAVMFLHWVGYRWDKHRHKPSWIDAMVMDAVHKSEEAGASRNIPRAL